MQSKKAQNLDFLIGYAIMVMITDPGGWRNASLKKQSGSNFNSDVLRREI